MANERISVLLEPRSIAACVELPEELAFMGKALQHQVDVFQKAVDHDIIVDSAPTGTGKTKAALSVLKHQPKQSAVYIAPTNALIDQQKQAAEAFVLAAGLPHIVIAASAKEIRQWSNQPVGSRPGEKLYNLLRNPATIFPEVGASRPVLLVTNPDIFYYATFFAYKKLDRINVASQFYSKFGTVIFDEFHLYDAKQLVGLLFYLAVSHEFGFFQQGRRAVLLTATPEPACEAALSSLERQGVRVAYIDGEEHTDCLLPSQTSVQLELRAQPDRDQFISELVNEIIQKSQSHPGHNGAVILDSLDQVNQLADLLRRKGLADQIGRITGPAPLKDRQRAMQCPIILATSTVDVGFNFERNPEPRRQNLDWLIFSCRDRAAFWQRLGRVGRVLGKPIADISSHAIAYLPERAWEEGLALLDKESDRETLKHQLAELSCLDRPFLAIYWQSEAFLEIARPLLQLEELMQGLAESELIDKLYRTLQSVLGGKQDWAYYRSRMMALKAAEEIAKQKDSQTNPLRFIKGKARWDIVTTFLRTECPEDWADFQAKRTTFQDYETVLERNTKAIEAFVQFCRYFIASYAPLFGFRTGLFENLEIVDPKGLILDVSAETLLDPIHLLRYYEFLSDGDRVEIQNRAESSYQISFRWRYRGCYLDFSATQLNKLKAFENCQIQRKRGDAIAPEALLTKLSKDFIPGVIICPIKNASAYYQLLRERVAVYPITVIGTDFEKDFVLLPGIAGILTIAMFGVRLRLPDNEEFLIY
ncbi:type I-D CRISPR-associated helicase Cas3' [Leptolyngbya sp. NIES-2104]|uniref:type I-D CRISPR-associated helicase Cas3' n=1 Tax=Leptolyngbya sp. NIES-2104 TaxID=1552121 RepID=UPI0006EC6C4D|nr:type I-D CRISPR-associated helicase Cas3' [Leptolyngbya sp. NIES-2104]GAP94325.1 CRISPR-associated helicase Cas3 [Leptolyngbya sp. NIES-2104]